MWFKFFNYSSNYFCQWRWNYVKNHKNFLIFFDRFSTINNNNTIEIIKIGDEIESLFKKDNLHSLPINSIAFLNKTKLITGSDDRRCILIDLNSLNPISTSFNFETSITKVQTNSNFKNQFLTSEIDGKIHLIDTKSNSKNLICRTEDLQYKLECPLLDLHWNPFDSTKVGAVASNNYYGKKKKLIFLLKIISLGY